VQESIQEPSAAIPIPLTASQQASRSRSIALLSADILLFWAALYLFVPVLSVYAKSLGASMSLIGLIIGSYGFVQLWIRIPLGLWSDRLGRRKPFVILAFAVVVVSLAGLAVAPSPIWLLVFRGLTGVAAATWVTTAVLYSSYFPKEQSVRASGLALFCMGVALVVATAAGGALADAYGWRSTFWLAIVPCTIGLALSLFLDDDKTVVRTKGFSLASLRAMKGARLLLITSLLAALTQYAAYATTYSFVPIYAANLGASRTQLGWLTTALLLPNTVATLIAARLAEKTGDRNLIAVGYILMALTAASIPLVRTVPVLMASRAAFGIGQGFVHPVTMGLSIKHIEPEQRATAMGIFQAVYAVGMFAGPALSGVFADGLGMATMFVITGSICLIGAVCALRLIEQRC
jgi:MFS family permease